MKKISLKIALTLLLSSTLFFGCAKEEVPATNCANVSASIVNDVATYQSAVERFSTSPTPANCNAVKTSLTSIINKIKDCPQFAPVRAQYDAALKDFNCN